MTLSPLTDFSDLVLRLYRLSHDESIDLFQDAALRLIKPVVAFDASMWGTATATGAGIDVHTLHLHEKSIEMIAAYEPIKHHDTAGASMAGHRSKTSAFHSETWFAAPEQAEYREFLRKFEQENTLITATTNPATNFVHWISLFRASPDHHCTSEDVYRLSVLAPHLMQALALNRVVHLGRIGLPTTLLGGSAIADLRGVVYHADAIFESMVRAEWEGWKGGALPAATLKHFAEGEARYIGKILVMTHRVEQKLLFIKVRKRCLADDLSPREYTIARMVSQGNTYKEIAQILKRSPATIRNQIQSVYIKLQVSNIAGLIAQLHQAD